MLCCICKQKKATVHLRQAAPGKAKAVDLCEECAEHKGVNDPAGFSLANLLLDLRASQKMEKAASEPQLNRPKFGGSGEPIYD